MQPKYSVIVILDAKPGKETELKVALQAVVEPQRKESGCLEYRLHEDVNSPARFIIYGVWENETVHDEQLEKPYIIALFKKLEDLLANPLQAFVVEQL